MATNTINDVVQRLKAEGQLTRNNGTNSIASVKELLNAGNETRLEINTNISEMRTMYDTVAARQEEGTGGIDEERRREDVARQEKMISALEGLRGGPGGGGSGGSSGGGIGGIFSKLGGMVSGLGIGAGALAGGLGLLVAGGGYLLDKLQTLDGAAVRANIKELLAIKDDFNGMGNFFLEGGAFGAAMVGIGLGLAVFAVGGAAAAAAQRFEQPGWTTKIKDNVKELLSIKDEVADGSLLTMIGEGGAFFAAMTGIGAGLLVFGVGSAVASAAVQFEEAGWAQKIVDNVTTLLGITDLLGTSGLSKLLGGVTEGGSFAFLMTGLGAGLAVFGAGSAVSAGVSKFQETDWAQKIVDNVKKLLEIPNLEGVGADTAGFLAVMTGIGAGLVAFAIGKGASGVADAITKFTGEDSIGTRVKSQVTELLSILDDPNVNQAKATEFAGVLGTLGIALTGFGAGKFVNTLADAAGAVLNFLTGTESPIDQVKQIAEDADQLELAARALTSIGDSLQTFAGLQFRGSEFNFKDFAEDLKDAVPIIEKAVLGDSGGVFSARIEGLASNAQAYEAAAANIQQLRMVLGDDGGSGPAPTIINNYYGIGGRSSGSGGGGGTSIVPISASPYPRDPNVVDSADGILL